jgi:dTDP-4-amino-4,6-dideoxygalactose transaminase
VEDAAQAVMASYKGRALGAISDRGSFSSRETKNIISGEGGSLLVRDPKLVPRAEIIREKRDGSRQVHRSEVDKYTWQDGTETFL